MNLLGFGFCGCPLGHVYNRSLNICQEDMQSFLDQFDKYHFLFARSVISDMKSACLASLESDDMVCGFKIVNKKMLPLMSIYFPPSKQLVVDTFVHSKLCHWMC